MISLFWKSSSDIISGFSQFNQRGRLADDIILHSSRLKQERRTGSKKHRKASGERMREESLTLPLKRLAEKIC